MKRERDAQYWERLARAAEFDPAVMAIQSGVSLRTLERSFKLQHQKTPKRWLRELQCRLAVSLIWCGKSNKEIASELHFANASHFCHEFKKVMGMPPKTLATLREDRIKTRECRF